MSKIEEYINFRIKIFSLLVISKSFTTDNQYNYILYITYINVIFIKKINFNRLTYWFL